MLGLSTFLRLKNKIVILKYRATLVLRHSTIQSAWTHSVIRSRAFLLARAWLNDIMMNVIMKFKLTPIDHTNYTCTAWPYLWRRNSLMLPISDNELQLIENVSRQWNHAIYVDATIFLLAQEWQPFIDPQHTHTHTLSLSLSLSEWKVFAMQGR